MINSRRTAVLVSLTFLSLLASACGDARELSATAIVLGIGIDESEGIIDLTVELSSADTNDAIVMQSRGAAMEACVKDIRLSNYEFLFWEGTAAVVFGDSIDENKADLYVLYLYRDLGVSGKTPLFRAWECSAADILKGRFSQAPYIAVGLSEAMSLEERSESRESLTLAERLKSSMGQGVQKSAALVTIGEDGHVRLVDLPQ